MFVEERHQEILRLLNEYEKVKVKELSKRFEVTEIGRASCRERVFRAV